MDEVGKVFAMEMPFAVERQNCVSLEMSAVIGKLLKNLHSDGAPSKNANRAVFYNPIADFLMGPVFEILLDKFRTRIQSENQGLTVTVSEPRVDAESSYPCAFTVSWTAKC